MNSRKYTSRIARSYAAKPGRADLRTMGDATRDCPPFPSMVVSKHMLSAKKTPICGIYKVDQSVTARYNFVVEPGLTVSPLQGGPALLWRAPGRMRFLMYRQRRLRSRGHKSTILRLGRNMAPSTVTLRTGAMG